MELVGAADYSGEEESVGDIQGPFYFSVLKKVIS